jgi:hypothetical protein
MYTNEQCDDGFGAQYQKIIQTYIFCAQKNIKYVYRPFKNIEHNYSNDPLYNNKIENLVNLKNNIENDIECKSIEINYNAHVRHFFEKYIETCCNSPEMSFIKKCFWENKDKNYFKNNKINIAIHIRRENLHDMGRAGERITTPNSYYLNIMNKIRNVNKDKDLLFHIYSQGNLQNFLDLNNTDVLFHLNENIEDTFIGLVAANILVISPSSLSYVAGLISDGIIYYKPFWHSPRENWIIEV